MAPFFTTLSPDWEIPGIKACTVLATATDSSLVSFSHDNPLAKECRKKLEQLVNPVHPINWLRQVHGNRIVELPLLDNADVEADGAYTSQKNTVCAVVTADCLPIVFANKNGTRVGVAHAGRKGLQNGILAEMIGMFDVSAREIHAWIGPGISAESYPISNEIREEVLDLSSAYETVFTAWGQGHYLMDLKEMARMQLVGHGISSEHIWGAEWNTFTDNRFHSARRDKEQSGRMATLVWME